MFFLQKNKRDIFFSKIKKYIDSGILQTIYVDEKISIFSFANLFYITCPYFYMENGDPFGYMTDWDKIEYTINNPDEFFIALKYMSSEQFMSHTVNLSVQTFDHHIKIIKNINADDFKDLINIEFEKYIKQKYSKNCESINEFSDTFFFKSRKKSK